VKTLVLGGARSGKSRFTLQSMPPEDFPLVQESASFGPTFSVPQKTLKSLEDALQKTSAITNMVTPAQ
jgi:DNA polymerase III sliding clamp (beta) subunit (PCNA family)